MLSTSPQIKAPWAIKQRNPDMQKCVLGYGFRIVNMPGREAACAGRRLNRKRKSHAWCGENNFSSFNFVMWPLHLTSKYCLWQVKLYIWDNTLLRDSPHDILDWIQLSIAMIDTHWQILLIIKGCLGCFLLNML